MKTIYFIRHGQSEGNLKEVSQDAHTELTDHGRKQAEFMAERCAQLPIDVLIASTMKRAHHTAEIIGKHIGKEPISSELFVERMRPSAQTGRGYSDPEWQAVEEERQKNFHDPHYRHSDEESFHEVKTRAQEALTFLKERPEENLAVVSHGHFLKYLLATILFGAEATPADVRRCNYVFHAENTGLTIIKESDVFPDTPWRIWVWNDHAHLG